MKKRVFICGIAQESNSFNPVTMTMDSFHPHSMEKSGYENAVGAREYFADKDVECIYGINMRSASGAPLSDDVVNYFLDNTLKAIEDAGELDGILFLFHGATMSESSDDVCGDISEAVRLAVGERVVISGGFDMHANITEKLVSNLDYICGYWEYPHIDQRMSGERAARMLFEHLAGKKRKTACAAIPMMAPAHAYSTMNGAPMELKKKAQKMIEDGVICDYTVFQVQPWLDNPLVRSTVIVIAEDTETACKVANELARDTFELREELQGAPLFSVDDVIEKAIENKSGKPIVLVDSADSIGAGSTGDSAYVVEKLLPYADMLRCATAVRDREAVKRAFEIGVGETAEFTLGSTISKKLSAPVKVTARIKSLHTGEFCLHGPIAAGATAYTGKTAVLEVGKLLIRVSEHAGAGGDLNYFNLFGICVENMQLVAVKACTSFRAGYESVACEICNTNTPGAACPVLFDLPYERLPKPTYPFEEITLCDITEAKIYR